MSDNTNNLTTGSQQTWESGTPIPPPRISDYELYLATRRQRETALFTRIGIVMAILLLPSIVIASGLVKVPFFNSFDRPTTYVSTGQTPCAKSTTPLKPKEVSVIVENGSTVGGIAAKTADQLKTFGFKIAQISNAERADYQAPVTIITGSAQVDAAYTAALAFPESDIEFQLGAAGPVKIILGSGFKGTNKAEEFKQGLSGNLKNRDGCLPAPDTF